ncbi:hypothetical protein D1AOALGA4SA_9210 [Olavius algarvensis Delta 1 endosymbiont]|nr:hypothetical protein D1AOALGA4SA_9210 [Olavius algarvensis Delta 1 endosymbiont]
MTGWMDVDHYKIRLFPFKTQYSIIPAFQHSMSQVPADCLKNILSPSAA